MAVESTATPSAATVSLPVVCRYCAVPPPHRPLCAKLGVRSTADTSMIVQIRRNETLRRDLTKRRSAAMRLHDYSPAHRPAAAVSAATRVRSRAPKKGGHRAGLPKDTGNRTVHCQQYAEKLHFETTDGCFIDTSGKLRDVLLRLRKRFL